MKKKKKYVFPFIKIVSFIVESGFRISANIGSESDEPEENTEKITTFHQEGEWF